MTKHDDDAPELTDAQLATAQPFREALPELAQRMETEIRRGRPPLENRKVAVSIRLDNDLVDKLKENGKGWQTIANRLLRDAVGL
ncbi:MAG: BrnA antitoxin family protein [Pseudomonadota bacterium]